jgi:S-adenosylmethionine-diacylglycerol 3-amino-3-carboxypropyl transferase
LRSDKEGFSKFVLLDHMDWLSTQHNNLLQAEWQAIFDRARPGAMALWRSGGARVEYVDPLLIRGRSGSERVGDLLRYDTVKADDCHLRDRVHTYGSFYIAHLCN